VTKRPKQFKPVRSNAKKFSLGSNKRETGRTKGYGKTWGHYRFKFLYYNKQCYACGRDAKVCDHVVAHKGDMNKFWDEKNYIPLCTTCHNIATGRFDKFDPPKTAEKMKWLERQRELNGVKVSVKVVPFGRLNREIRKLVG